MASRGLTNKPTNRSDNMLKKVTIKNRYTGLESDYRGLSEEDSEYLQAFEKATQRMEPKLSFEEAQKKNPDLFHSKEAYMRLYSYRDDIRDSQKDLMSSGQRVDIDPTKPSFGPDIINKIRSQVEYCRRCMKVEAECHCEAVQRHSPYSEGDWRQDVVKGPEEQYTELMGKHLKAFDLRPTGNAPLGLKEGTVVIVSLQNHVLKGKLAKIIRLREQDGKYEVLAYNYKGGVRGFFSPNELKVSR
jgi:hypothetical protein